MMMTIVKSNDTLSLINAPSSWDDVQPNKAPLCRSDARGSSIMSHCSPVQSTGRLLTKKHGALIL